MKLFLLLLLFPALAHAEDVARSSRWLRLLHYKSHWFTGTHSSVAGPGFFFAPNGRRDPEAELRATVKALSDPKPISRLPQPAACAFPARFRFLNESLHLGLKQPECPRWQEFLDRFHGHESATLVFSTAFPNNPASMFGHSFLRINARQPKVDLLDSGLSYAAQVAPDENNFSFIFLGLTGGYPGTFSAVPYYAKVAEYNDSESRDLWEYDLNLDQDQTWWLLANVWELEVNSYSDYYFFDENCSYEILTLLDVARPDWNVSPYFFHNIPSETIKRVTGTPGAVKAVHFRPSLFRRLNAYGDRLSKAERQEFFQEIDGNIPERPTAASLDAAAQYFYFRKQNKLTEQETEHFQRALAARAALGVPPAPEPIYDETSRPDWGHHASRISLGEGVQKGSRNGYGAFTELGIKPAYHDLLNHDTGFVPFSEISFPHVTLREFPAESRFYVRQLEFLRINSLSPWSWLKHSLSWRAAVDYQVPDDLCSFCHVLHGEGSVGISEPIANDQLRAYQLLGVTADAGKPLARRWRVGPLATVGLLANATKNWKHWLEASASFDPFRVGSEQLVFATAQWAQSYFFSQSWEARLTTRATFSSVMNREEASLHALYYF